MAYVCDSVLKTKLAFDVYGNSTLINLMWFQLPNSKLSKSKVRNWFVLQSYCNSGEISHKKSCIIFMRPSWDVLVGWCGVGVQVLTWKFMCIEWRARTSRLRVSMYFSSTFRPAKNVVWQIVVAVESASLGRIMFRMRRR